MAYALSHSRGSTPDFCVSCVLFRSVASIDVWSLPPPLSLFPTRSLCAIVDTAIEACRVGVGALL